MKVECKFQSDMLRGASVNSISIHFVEFLDDTTQFMLNDEDPIYFKLGKVILQEKNEENNSFALELRGYLSATNGNFRPLGTFTVTVYTKEDKLYGSIL